MNLNSSSIRILGVLIEKESTTPDQYPLTINSLTLGCNQKTNRFPITHLTESEVQQTCDQLLTDQFIFRHHTAGGRAAKYHHQFQQRFNPSKLKLQILSALFLKGELTPGEILLKCKRVLPDLNLEELNECLHQEQQLEQPWFSKLERQPGQKEARWQHNWGQENTEDTPLTSFSSEPSHPEHTNPESSTEASQSMANSSPSQLELEEEVISLREEVQFLRDEVQELKSKIEELF